MTTELSLRGAPRAVLHPTDFSAASELAFAHALRIALDAKGRFYILHTGREPREEVDWEAFPEVRGTLVKWGLLEDGAPAEAVFEHLGVRIRKDDVYDDDPVRAIVRFLDRRAIDLIVLATHGREGWQRWLHHSVAEPVAREASLPALFLADGARGFVDPKTGRVELRRIVVPIDHEPRPDAALDEAGRLIRTLGVAGCDLELLHVGDPARAPSVSVPEHGWSRVEMITREGGIVDAIVERAAGGNADLIAMATQGHSGFLDALRGSTTEQVVRRADCPVLAVPAI